MSGLFRYQYWDSWWVEKREKEGKTKGTTRSLVDCELSMCEGGINEVKSEMQNMQKVSW